MQFSEAVVSTTSGGNLDRTDLVYTPGSTSISSLTDANALDLLLTFTTGVAIASGDTIGAASGKIADLTGNGLGTAAVAITEPAATKDTVQDGSWDNPTTWLGGTLPLPSDNVVIRHNVTFPAQTGGDTLIYDTNSVKFDGGSLSAPPTTVGSAFTIIAVNSRVVEAVTNATVTNVQFYDYATSADFVFRVASSRTLTLSNSFQGHFVRIVVKQGPGVLVWDSPQNIYPFGEYDGGPTRIEAGTLRMNQANGRDPAFGLAIASGATLDLRQNFGSSDLTGQGTITRSIAGTAVLTLYRRFVGWFDRGRLGKRERLAQRQQHLGWRRTLSSARAESPCPAADLR